MLPYVVRVRACRKTVSANQDQSSRKYSEQFNDLKTADQETWYMPRPAEGKPSNYRYAFK